MSRNSTLSSDDRKDALAEVQELRMKIRAGEWREATSGVGNGVMQANVVILPKEWADDFLIYCQNNPISCPLLAVSKPGSCLLEQLGTNIDIRSDIPEYNIYRDGLLSDTTSDISSLWQEDWVTFALGCSFSFEKLLQRSGLGLRNIEEKKNVSMYRTNIETKQSHRFYGNTVVSMRPFTASDAIRAIQITARLPKAHGAPIHLGDPALIGINNITQPDYGDAVTIYPDELPVFWACGVTPQVAIENAKPPIAITHVPGKMLLTDWLIDDMLEF